MKVSKDGGQTFVEISDDPEQQQIAQSKGYDPYVEVTNGEKRARIKGTPDQMKIAQDKGYNLIETADNQAKATKPREPYSPLMSAAHGAANTMALGFGDEIYGGIEAAKAIGSGKPMSPAYMSGRDAYRNEYKKSADDNPASNFVGQFAGGALLPGAAAVKGGSLGKAILSGAKVGGVQGAIQGAGEADEADDVLGGAAFGGLTGGVMGGAGGLIGRAITRPKRTAADIREAVTEDLPNYVRAGFKGAAEAGKKGNESFGSMGALVKAPMGAIEVVDQRRQMVNLQKMVDESRASGESVQPGRYYEKPMLQIASPKDPRIIDAEYVDEVPKSFADAVKTQRTPEISSEVTNKEYVARMLTEPGPSKIKQFYAEKGASQYPGQLDSETYNSILEMGPESRNAARRFNRDEAGGALVPGFNKAREVFDDARSQRWNELHGEARSQYEGNDKILMSIGDALEDAASENGTKSIKGILEDVQNFVAAGKGAKGRGFKEGAWDQVDGSERFNRLQQARRELYDTGVHAKMTGLSRADQIIKKLTKEIDAELKISPEKVEADGMWSKSKSLEESFFDPTDFKGGVDKYKIGNMLKGTDSAKRFRDNIGRFEEFISDPNLNPKLKNEGQKLLKEFKGAASTAEQQRILNDFRYRNGPSGAAIDRQTAVLGGQTSPLAEAVTAPSGFLSSADQFTKDRSRRFYGKPYSQLAPSEKDKLMKLWFWEKKNPDHGQDDLEKYFRKLK